MYARAQVPLPPPHYQYVSSRSVYELEIALDMSSRSLLISFPLLRTSHCGLTPDRSGAVFLSLFHDIFILFSRCRGPWGLSASRAATAPSRPPRAPSAARRRLRRGASRQARRTSSGESRTCSRPPPLPPSAPPTVTLNLPLSSTIFHYLPLSPTIFQYLPLSSSIFHSLPLHGQASVR